MRFASSVVVCMDKHNSPLLRRVAEPANLRQAWFRKEFKGAQGMPKESTWRPATKTASAC